MKNFKKISYLSLLTIAVVLSFAVGADAQDRQRIVKQNSSRPINQLAAQPLPLDKTRSLSSSAPSSNSTSFPTLTNNISVVRPEQPLVKKTGSSSPLRTITTAAAGMPLYNAAVSGGLMRGIQDRLGIPYLYGSMGPNRYDCSGFVWAVFNQAGIPFERTSARALWNANEPVSGDERFKFGTLVFFNGLGHMGIVADAHGFYHASSSKGITYSKFEGYWGKRIVGFRRIVQRKQQHTESSLAQAK